MIQPSTARPQQQIYLSGRASELPLIHDVLLLGFAPGSELRSNGLISAPAASPVCLFCHVGGATCLHSDGIQQQQYVAVCGGRAPPAAASLCDNSLIFSCATLLDWSHVPRVCLMDRVSLFVFKISVKIEIDWQHHTDGGEEHFTPPPNHVSTITMAVIPSLPNV